MKNVPKIVVTKTTGHGDSGNGAYACVEVVDSNGVTAVIMIPHDGEADFQMRFQGACVQADQKRRQAAGMSQGSATGGQIARPLKVAAIGTGVTPDQKLALRVELADQLGFDLILEAAQIEALRKTLNTI